MGAAQSRVFERLVVGGPFMLTELAAPAKVTKRALAPTVTRMVDVGIWTGADPGRWDVGLATI